MRVTTTTCAAALRSLTTPLNPWRGWDGTGIPASCTTDTPLGAFDVEPGMNLDDIQDDATEAFTEDVREHEGAHAIACFEDEIDAAALFARGRLEDTFGVHELSARSLRALFAALDAAEALETEGKLIAAAERLRAAAKHARDFASPGYKGWAWIDAALSFADAADESASVMETAAADRVRRAGNRIDGIGVAAIAGGAVALAGLILLAVKL